MKDTNIPIVSYGIKTRVTFYEAQVWYLQSFVKDRLSVAALPAPGSQHSFPNDLHSAAATQRIYIPTSDQRVKSLLIIPLSLLLFV